MSTNNRKFSFTVKHWFPPQIKSAKRKHVNLKWNKTNNPTNYILHAINMLNSKILGIMIKCIQFLLTVLFTICDLNKLSYCIESKSIPF